MGTTDPAPHFKSEPRPISDSHGGTRQPSQPRPVTGGARQPSQPRPIPDAHQSFELRPITGGALSEPRAVSDGHAGARQSLDALAPAQPRRVPIPTQPELDDHISLRERLETPLKVVAAGVALSVADALARPFIADFPVRPLWLAEILVVVGVLWALARMLLPSSSRS